MSTTTDVSSTPEGQGSTTSTTEGAGTQTATTEARFTQDQVDSIIKARLAEQAQKLTAKLEKTWTEKLQTELSQRETQLEATIEERVQTKLNEHALAAAHTEIKAAYGLSDAQIERLTGATPEELKADAETLFGSLKQQSAQGRKPPTLRTGSDAPSDSVLDLSQMTPAQIREKGSEIFTRLHRS